MSVSVCVSVEQSLWHNKCFWLLFSSADMKRISKSQLKMGIYKHENDLYKHENESSMTVIIQNLKQDMLLYTHVSRLS